MASLLTVALLIFSILVVAECNHHYGHEGGVDFYHNGPVPIPGRRGLLNFILLVPQKKKEAFCRGYVEALDNNHNVDIDYGFGYGPGIVLDEYGSSSSSGGRSGGKISTEQTDIVIDIPGTKLVFEDNAWLIAQEIEGKHAHGNKRVYPVSLERYCRLFLITYY